MAYMKILITGAAGLLGIELTRQLLDDGHEVHGVDNFYTSDPHNIDCWADNTSYHFIEWDIQQTRMWDTDYDQIYNLACPASPVHYQRDPQYTLDTNINGVRNMLVLAETIDAVLIQASTSETYGDPLEHPQRESYWGNVNALGPRACYDEGKRVAETMCMLSSAHTRIARIFNTYGPTMEFNDGRAVSNFIYQALSGDDITIHGDGLQTRSFCYVSDTVLGLIYLANSKVSTPVNIGNPDEVTLLELVNDIIEISDSSSNIIYEARVADDPSRRCPDITKAIDMLQWNPIVSRHDGLSLTIDSFKTRTGRNI
jgi:UDP-glucuronate decarboxylase